MELQRKPQSRIVIFFEKKFDSVGYMFERNKILIVFILFVMDFFREIFRQIKMETTIYFLLELVNDFIIREEDSMNY